jgi:hypothetical protein
MHGREENSLRPSMCVAAATRRFQLHCVQAMQKRSALRSSEQCYLYTRRGACMLVQPLIIGVLQLPPPPRDTAPAALGALTFAILHRARDRLIMNAL